MARTILLARRVILDSDESRKRRVSLTKLQRQSAAGVDLIALCQTVTEDGSLSDDEVMALREWVEEYHNADLPAHAHLATTIERIIADGRVTDDERRELYLALEVILPPDVREPIRAKRRAREAAARQQEREERQFNTSLGTWNFMVAGVRYEGRPDVIRRYAHPGAPAYLIRDRNNTYSRNAIEVRLHNGMQIGFVPEEDAIEIAPRLDDGLPHKAVITKILTGGRSPIPVVEVDLFRQGATVDKLVVEADVPIKVLPTLGVRPSESIGSSAAVRRRSGRLFWLLFLAGAVVLAVAVVIGLMWKG
jgi:hypothetical protein